MSSVSDSLCASDWWDSLNHGGLLISPERVVDHFPESLEPLSYHEERKLYRVCTFVSDAPERYIGEFTSTVFEDLLGYRKAQWKKGTSLDSSFSVTSHTGMAWKPWRVWFGSRGEQLPVFLARDPGGKRGLTRRLGIGRGRRPYSLTLEWLRAKNQPLAFLTNGRELRLMHAGPDYDAWAEWQLQALFEEGQPSPQLTALRVLIDARNLERRNGEEPALLRAVAESRKGQGELSRDLGERVRKAVEELISATGGTDHLGEDGNEVRALYLAATRAIMRCVVILFSEARDLLPRDNALYSQSYGLQSLTQLLSRQAGIRGADRLRNSHTAWPRILSLFRLMYYGSAHESLVVPEYGGALFEPGDSGSADAVLRAISLLERPETGPHDYSVHRILQYLTRTTMRIKQGKQFRTVSAPVDFSDLSSEYIGILYEGLLDFELRRAPADDPVVFLNVGNQPALPLSRLEAMGDSALKGLFDALKKEKASIEEEEGDELPGDTEETDDAMETSDDDATSDESPAEDDESDSETVGEQRISEFCRRAALAAKLVKKLPAKASAPQREKHEQELNRAARSVAAKTVVPGRWYLVQWGGTRKGAGTFYTRPQLARPTVRRTLEPLVWDEKTGRRAIRKPEEILALKVCDPAMGSASFLVSAIRYLTDALFQSLAEHQRLEKKADGTVCRLTDGAGAKSLRDETIPVPIDHEDFDDRLRAVLKRHIIERCIYGVDVDPLAVELGRMALWVETMDPLLPFGFLDHKLKVGNSLVGSWMNEFQEYPVIAFKRDGIDKKKKGVHHESDSWHGTLKEYFKSLSGGMIEHLNSRTGGFEHGFLQDEEAVGSLHDKAVAALGKIHQLHIHETENRRQLYQRLRATPEQQDLKFALDLWAALWFWPLGKMRLCPAPTDFMKPGEKSKDVVESIASTEGFFHWEYEFPDVFTGLRSGFDAILGNPPWETVKPSSKEYFSNIDPLYRTYGKQEALDRQRELFRADPEEETLWLRYQDRFAAMSHFTRHCDDPFGDPEVKSRENFSFSRKKEINSRRHHEWRALRTRHRTFSAPEHAYASQGTGDVNTYKLFLERGYRLLKPHGRMGLLVPGGVYSDKGSQQLRELFLGEAAWDWLYGFENRDGIFDIHRSFKFCAVIVEKGGRSSEIQTSFMNRDLNSWEMGVGVLRYPRSLVDDFSPYSKSLVEIRSPRDREILEKIYSNGVLLGDESHEGWGIKYTREFDMTNDSKLFPPRPKWEAKGYVGDEYGHWLKGEWKQYSGATDILQRPAGVVLSVDGKRAIDVDQIEDVALPLYEGRMIGQFDFSQKGWVSGKGRSAVWRNIPWENKVIEPQYLMGLRDFEASSKPTIGEAKTAYMRISSSTNSRSMISALLDGVPCGDSVFLFGTRQPCIATHLHLALFLNSIAYDFALRQRFNGLNLSEFVVVETALPKRFTAGSKLANWANTVSGRLGLVHARHTGVLSAGAGIPSDDSVVPALTENERLRLRVMVDAVAAVLFGLSRDDLGAVLLGCDYPTRNTGGQTNPKGFWRVDKDKDPELRQTVLTLVAMHELERAGSVEAFLNLNDGEGWMIPDTLRLANYDLGHDARAKSHQPVADRLGPRFLPWQLEKSAEERWRETQLHAELIRRIRKERV